MYEEVIKSLRQAYDDSAVERDKRGRGGWKVVERLAFLNLLQQEEKKSLLEIGAGPGLDSKFFQENGLQVVATDLSPQMVQLCHEKGLEAHVMDFKNLDFQDDHFDAVYALNCLLHVPKSDLPEILVAIRRLMRPGGLFYMAVYGGEESEGLFEDDHHRPKRFFSFYTDEQMMQLAGSLFEIYDFKVIQPQEVSEGLHVQRLILRKIVLNHTTSWLN